MDLPALPPDVTFHLLSRGKEDVEFALDAKRRAIGPTIAQRWGWDDAFQRDLHERRFGEKPFFEIRRSAQRLGTVSFDVMTDHVRFGEFYLFPDFQKQCIGSAVLAHCLSLADDLRLPVGLEYLHWNPVGSLYRRHGIIGTGRSETHYHMERASSREAPD